MVELLKQPQYQPLNVVDQVLVIFAASSGGLDKVDVADVRRWEDEFLRFIHDKKKDVWELVDKHKDDGDALKKDDHETTKAVSGAIDEFNASFRPSHA